MTAAAATATKMIYTFRPRYIIMVGIAAGIVKSEMEEKCTETLSFPTWYGIIRLANSLIPKKQKTHTVMGEEE